MIMHNIVTPRHVLHIYIYIYATSPAPTLGEFQRSTKVIMMPKLHDNPRSISYVPI